MDISMTTDRQAILRPNRDHMLAMMSALFGEAMKGQIELAWTDATDRAVNNASLFDTADLDAVVDRAAVLNETEGRNIYFGMATRSPYTAPFGRANDTDYFATHAVAVDLDAAGAVEAAKAIYDRLNLRPTFAVVTGEHPHRRAQLWWKLDAPLTNPKIHREIQSGLAACFNGDPTIVNPSRIMRLAGSIAWPKKAGRVVEMTAFYPVSGTEYPVDRLLAVARGALKDATVNQSENVFGRTKGLGLDIGHVGADIDALIHEASVEGRWHESVLRLVASLVGKGLPDSAIYAMAPGLTTAGYTVSQTEDDIRVMIEGARAKGFTPQIAAQPEPTAQQGAQAEAAKAFDIFDWDISKAFAGPAPELEWLIEGVIESGSQGVLAGKGGIGKSFLALDACIAIANRPLVGAANAFGNAVINHGNAVLITGEESAKSVHRRIESLDEDGKARRREGSVFVVPLPNQKGVAPILHSGAFGALQIAAGYESVVAQIKRVSDLRLIVLDPMQIFVMADLNDPAVTQAWWALMSELSAETGAAVIATHHMNKASLQATTLDEARQGIRGNTGVVDGARMAYALWHAPKGEADKIAMRLGKDPEETEIVFGGVVKINGPGDKRIHTFIRNAGGLLDDVTSSVHAMEETGFKITESLARAVSREIEHAWRDGKPWSMNPQAKRALRYFPEYAKRTWDMDRHILEGLMSDWQSEGIVTVDVRDSKTKASGLRMLQNPWA